MSTRAGREGFSLVEVIVALVILTFGVLALASATGFFFTQIRVADYTTDRTMAVEQTAEEIRSMPYDDVVSVSEGSAETRNGFDVWYSVSSGDNVKNITIYTKGRGYTGNSWDEAMLDSFQISISTNMQQR